MKFLYTLLLCATLSSLSFSQSYSVEWGKIQNGESIDGDLIALKNGKTSALAKAILKGSSDTTDTKADGYVQYIIEDFNVIRHMGFSSVEGNVKVINDLKYSFHIIKGKKLKVTHSRKMLGIHNIDVNDTLRIERLSGVMNYYINSQMIHSVKVNPEENLVISVNLFGKNALMSGIRTNIRVEPLSVLVSVDNTNNSFDYTISGGSEQGYELKIESTDEVFQGAQGTYELGRKGTIGFSIIDSDGGEVFREVTIGEDINWTDFNNTIVSNGVLIVSNDSLTGFGTAKSQQIIPFDGDWIGEYVIKFDQKSKTWGIMDSLGGQLSNYLTNFYISDFTSMSVSYFVNGQVQNSFVANNGDILRMEMENGVISAFYNGILLQSVSFSFNQNYQITALLKSQSSFDQITFLSNFKSPIESFYDSETNSGRIQVNIPDSHTGPFHYLIGSDGYVDLNSLFSSITDSLGYPLDSTFLEAKDTSRTYEFNDLQPMTYYISVLDNENRVILKETVIINQELLLADNSNLHKEGNLFVSQENNTYVDFPLFISKEESQKSYVVELFNVLEEQYFGFGVDTVEMTSISDIKYGYYISNGQAYPILNGVTEQSGFWVQSKSTLGLTFDNGEIGYLVNTKEVIRDSIDFNSLGEASLNLKHGLSKPKLIYKPVIVNLIRFPKKYNLEINVSPLLCTEEYTDVEISLNIKGGFFYTPVITTYEVIDVDGNSVGTVTPNTISIVQNLPPGHYLISGVIQYNAKNQFIPSLFLQFSEYFVVGYPVKWINKLSTVYDSQDESLEKDGSGGIPLGTLDFGHASSNNKITENVNWVDFKIRNFKRFVQVFSWSTQPASNWANLGDGFLMINFSPNQIYLIHNLLTTIAYSKDDRFKLSYDGSQISLYRNYGVPILNFNATSTDYERINVFLSNFISDNSGIFDVYTNMSCFIPVLSYAKLQKDLKGGYVLSENDELKIYFEENYSQLNLENLEINIYDFQRNQMIVPSTDIYEYDDNRYVLDISSLNLQDESFYTLEVIINKNVKHFLKFKYKA